jgi:hypothetical protein
MRPHGSISMPGDYVAYFNEIAHFDATHERSEFAVAIQDCDG